MKHRTTADYLQTIYEHTAPSDPRRVGLLDAIDRLRARDGLDGPSADFKAGQDLVASLIMKALDRQPWPMEEATTSLNLALTAALLRSFSDDKGSEKLAELRAKSSPVLDEIAAERARQVAKGYDAAHDDEQPVDLAVLAAAIALGPDSDLTATDDNLEDKTLHILRWNPSRRSQLIIAASLLVAEIERLDRAEEELRAAQRLLGQA